MQLIYACTSLRYMPQAARMEREAGADSECRKLIEAARSYVRRAAELLKAGDLPNAAEKAWAAVRSATTALALRTRGTPAKPEGVAWREFVRGVLMGAGLSEEEASRWAAYFIDARDRLHGACFYGLQCEEPEHRPLIERAGEYVSLVEKLLGPAQHDSVMAKSG
jgi:HEPN domain-containing protein